MLLYHKDEVPSAGGKQTHCWCSPEAEKIGREQEQRSQCRDPALQELFTCWPRLKRGGRKQVCFLKSGRALVASLLDPSRGEVSTWVPRFTRDHG